MQQMRQIREIIALVMLAISAYTDIREKHIYIMPLVISASGAVIISLIQLVAHTGDDILRDKLVLPAVTGIIITTVIYVYREHIGMGDAYLLAALGTVIGNRYNIFTMTVSLFSVALYAVISIVAGRIGRWRGYRSIPFAPFVMVGFLIAMTVI